MFSPSSADSTEMAGVIVASPYTSAAPIRPAIKTSGWRPCIPAQKRHQRENAAFAFIVRAHGQRDVFQRGDDDQRPQDQ
jgi:hypothetical protein